MIELSARERFTGWLVRFAGGDDCEWQRRALSFHEEIKALNGLISRQRNPPGEDMDGENIRCLRDEIGELRNEVAGMSGVLVRLAKMKAKVPRRVVAKPKRKTKKRAV